MNDKRSAASGVKAIIYTSNTGFTAEYARLFGERTGLPVFALSAAAREVGDGSEVVYLGWLMASIVKGYKNAAKRYNIRAVCGVGMGTAGSQIPEMRKANGFPETLPVFSFQGGFDITKLHGIYRLMMTVMKKSVGKGLSEKPDKTPEESDMLDLMLNGGSRVDARQLSPLLEWYENDKKTAGEVK